jgi:UDP-sulfoquinovose synthase
MKERLQALKERFGKELRFWEGDLREYGLVEQIFRDCQGVANARPATLR